MALGTYLLIVRHFLEIVISFELGQHHVQFWINDGVLGAVDIIKLFAVPQSL